ncbi:hypothetical protein PHLGIDRAFT_285783 [Phlebiopsis gigantea 11061_1 CR5-6]|uniref:Uncharacterized protein n=1 Tax=Phlebiopsis gigantea (strain 11061_1 CR5-6) TaxID=745531 RepID=A0A0C3S0S0_PHLG1|nr:hypothetical protein PHLGIDRAFT_285783 [Phlebiopsis gigantea 11061_1 CR5-6]
MRTHACLLSGCTARCTSLTDVVLHPLASPYPSLTRAQLDAYAQTSRCVRSSSWPARWSAPAAEPSAVGFPSLPSTNADACWAGSKYRYICCNPSLPTRQAVPAHLRSSVHDNPIYDSECKQYSEGAAYGQWLSERGQGEVKPWLKRVLKTWVLRRCSVVPSTRPPLVTVRRL